MVAGPYDGKWGSQGADRRCTVVIVNLAVGDGAVTGGSSTGATFNSGAKMGPDGNVTLVCWGAARIRLIFGLFGRRKGITCRRRTQSRMRVAALRGLLWSNDVAL